jgi:hypothetical protein
VNVPDARLESVRDMCLVPQAYNATRFGFSLEAFRRRPCASSTKSVSRPVAPRRRDPVDLGLLDRATRGSNQLLVDKPDVLRPAKIVERGAHRPCDGGD